MLFMLLFKFQFSFTLSQPTVTRKWPSKMGISIFFSYVSAGVSCVIWLSLFRLDSKVLQCVFKKSANFFTYALFYISNTFLSNVRLKFAKNQAKAKQHPQTELLLFDNYLLSSSMLSSKNNGRYSEKYARNKCVCFNEIIWLMTMKMRLEINEINHIDTTYIDLGVDIDIHILNTKCILVWCWLYVLSNT